MVIYKKENVIAFYGKDDYMSNHYESKFMLDGSIFRHVEQAMMFLKAKLFGDDEMAMKIFNSYNPKRCKELGRRVRNFEQNVWDDNKCDIVKRCVRAKFKQNVELNKKLRDTKNALIVEASPHDDIWGVKLHKNDIKVTNPNKWKGKNLLGKIIMEVREEINQPVWGGY